MGLEFADVRTWLETELPEVLQKRYTDSNARKFYRGLVAAHRTLGKWLGPRTENGQCKRAPQETLAFALLGCTIGWLHVYLHSPRRLGLSGTRYLPLALQRELLLKSPALHPDAWAAIVSCSQMLCTE